MKSPTLTNPGSPAFPVETTTDYFFGLTKREVFALVLAHASVVRGGNLRPYDAADMADRLLKELE